MRVEQGGDPALIAGVALRELDVAGQERLTWPLVRKLVENPQEPISYRFAVAGGGVCQYEDVSLLRGEAPVVAARRLGQPELPPQVLLKALGEHRGGRVQSGRARREQ